MDEHAGHTHAPAGGDEHAAHTQGEARNHGGHDHAHMVADFRRRFWISLILTLPILALSSDLWGMLGLEAPVRFRGDHYVLFGLSSIVFFYGGWPFLTGFAEEFHQRQPGMMTLIAVAISAAYFYSSAVTFGLPGMGFYWELATLIDIMLLGHWIEMKSVLGASGALEALVRLLPSEAHRLKADGTAEDVPASEIALGDKLLVKPGERVPTDGMIVSGQTSLDESMLTGESKLVEKGEGAEAIGGSVNGAGAITLEVKKTGGQTYLAQVMDMVRRAQASRSRTQDLANRAAVWLTAIALGGGLATLIVWLVLGRDFAFSMERAITVMVIACPHALGLAVPLVVAVSTSMSASHGLLIRDRAAFERARNLDVVVFDKTGTLTEGRFGVSDIVPLGELDETACLRLAAALESQSEHPIAAGIVRTAQARQLEWPPVRNFRNLTGRGAQAEVEGRDVKVASPAYLREQGIQVQHPRLEALAAEGKTTIFLLVDGVAAAVFGLADVVRPESKAAIARLKAMGIQCMMLTGDSKAVAQTVSRQLGLDDYFAEVLPEQKADKIRGLKGRGLTVAMVGDGVNDAPALVESDLGVAIGAGTDVAIESADIVLVSNNPEDVAAILGLSRRTYGKMIQNLIWATGYNAFAIPLAAGVGVYWGLLLTPAVGAVLMSASTVIVAINAQLLGRGGMPAAARA
ncbi:MAG: copper-translocating P-type ATPase [Hydrogenophilales bacterium 17-64-65]|nr:MAG: copper-translocating P-type ATPase [Hydrogenophilales bacterium 16-64-40]OZA32487.1 MAG: copper-translocating P-type ATPase [Hydrogenophilales bacterium 17-64-65]